MSINTRGIRTLRQLEDAFRAIAKMLSLPWDLFPDFSGSTERDGEKVSEVYDGFCYVDVDTRAGPTEIWRGSDSNELMYRILCNVCLLEASDWKSTASGLWGEDLHEAFIRRQLDNVGAIDPEWRQRLRREYSVRWKKGPYRGSPFPL